jgi:osmotically inducible protein OsmC
MPRIVREADASWEGTVARGAGVVSAGSSATFLELPMTIASRIEVHQGKTSPEELLAAAHAACFITSLGSELAREGAPPERMTVRCTITMDEPQPGGGHRIVASAIEATAWVPGAGEALLGRAAEAADAGCPFSNLIRATAEVSVTARVGEED